MQKLNQKLANFGFEANVPAIHDEPEKSGLKVLKPSKSDSELIDDMFATSGWVCCLYHVTKDLLDLFHATKQMRFTIKRTNKATL